MNKCYPEQHDGKTGWEAGGEIVETLKFLNLTNTSIESKELNNVLRQRQLNNLIQDKLKEIAGITAQKTTFSFSRCSEKIGFPEI